jgi:glutathione S-transferase
MHLYSHIRSPWCRKVEWALVEMNLVNSLQITVIPATNPQQSEGMMAMKAVCGAHATAPSLVNGNFILSESSAIVFYLAETNKYNGSFLPNSAEEKAKIMAFDRICDITLGANILSPWLRNTMFLGDNKPDEKVFLKAKENFEKLEPMLSETLKKSSFLCGEHFTYADVGMSHLLASLIRVDGPRLKDSKAQKWFESCVDRTAYKTLAARETEAPTPAKLASTPW